MAEHRRWMDVRGWTEGETNEVTRHKKTFQRVRNDYERADTVLDAKGEYSSGLEEGRCNIPVRFTLICTVAGDSSYSANNDVRYVGPYNSVIDSDFFSDIWRFLDPPFLPRASICMSSWYVEHNTNCTNIEQPPITNPPSIDLTLVNQIPQNNVKKKLTI